ncbi:unnamed protein product [Adineta ricciae]|uniref:Uncharacterized protein n=1 Tax=Adineta ricciae TaxID=249248 RepID=A0A815YH81_ADIRI|nr:unnamed protein product [Adineta ricciae]
MLGGFLKLTLFLHVVFMFVTLLWQVAIAEASSNSATDKNLGVLNKDATHLLTPPQQQSIHLVKDPLNFPVDVESLVDKPPARTRTRHRIFRKKLHPSKLTNSKHVLQSTGIRPKKHRSSKRVQSMLDDRLKRFRMLDTEEFQEMLKSMSQQQSSEQPTGFNNIDTIDGIQLENYWSRK